MLLTDKQKIQHEKALKSQNALFQYALKYLFKTYGVKHIGRPMPFSQKPIQYMLLFCSNEHLHMIVGWIARVKRWFEKA